MMKEPMHPGEVLKTLYLEPLDLSEGKLAAALGTPRTRIERLVKGTTKVTTDTAVRLATFFGTTPVLWMNMQTNYDLAHAEVDISEIEPIQYA